MNSNIEKIALGSDVEILAVDSKARIPLIYGNGNIVSINICAENKDKSKVYNVSFPLLDGQTLANNDYIGPDGLHIGEQIIEFSSEQKIAYGLLQDIVLYPGYTHIYSTGTTSVTMKIYYQSIYARDSQIYVLDKYEQLIAVFNKEDDETLINPRIQKTQNSESVFTFSIDLHNPKWQEINNPENLYMVDGMVFSTNFDTSFQESITDNDEKIMNVTAYERQKLLSRKFVRTWNSTTNIGDGTENSIDIFMVVVLSKGDLELKNNGNLVESNHLKGTSGYALDALLYGTGWTTGDCDVEGEFDLETDQLTIYENILKVQELWGGILVFDSVNKIVHHRDETKWLPYDGYEVKYRKNMQSLEKNYNNKIITRLCPLGESNLNIKSVNNDSEWLENFSFTDSVLEGVENNPDITDPEQLKKWGERKLQDLCKPAKELTVETILLYQVEGYELETIDLNHIVDVINYNEIDGDIEQLRVVSFEYGVWDKADAVIELSDITLESTDIFKKTVSAANSINSGTLDSSKVIVYYKNGISVDESLRQVDTTIQAQKTTLEKSDEEIRATVTVAEDRIDGLDDAIPTLVTKADLAETIEGLQQSLSTKGGYNLIKNSVGYFGNDYWEGNVVNSTDTEIRLNNESNSAFLLQEGSIMQEINNMKNGTYNISFNYKKLLEISEIKVKINDKEFVTLTESGWARFEQVVVIDDNYFRIEFNSTGNDSCLISDLILCTGAIRQIWTQNQNETMSDTVSIGKGIQVESSETKNIYTRIDSDGNRVFNRDTGEVTTEMTDKGIKTKELEVEGEALINNLFISPVDDQVWLTGLTE